ncbi:hypothetical protein LSH36_156g03017 [Paralvinella palmiformis]|uniref:C2 domain-containing protein n=1 Tax=Paralvinella palmiformis TaxID=53620 RepID=A0AAD9JUK7_9ANNE|nr:hypothetical protein LSH36_156g03017 [Paralvinella palmiformis]
MYDSEQSLLTVRLIQASDLVPRDFSGSLDPYCRLRLLPNQKLQLQSKVQRKTRCPEFEEEFIFDVQQSDMGSRTLEILVFDFDQYSRDECIGQVHMPLEHVELSRDPTFVCRAIMPYDDQKQVWSVTRVWRSRGLRDSEVSQGSGVLEVYVTVECHKGLEF